MQRTACRWIIPLCRRPLLLPREGMAALTAQACLPQQLEAPVEKGQTVGTVQVYHGETLLGEYEVKAAADAPRMDFGTAFSLLWGSSDRLQKPKHTLQRTKAQNGPAAQKLSA